MALNPNISTATGKTSAGNLTESYISAVDLAHTFSIYPEFFARYDQFGGPNFLTFFEDLGMYKVTDQSVYYHYEKNWIVQGQKILSTGTASGQILPVTIDTVSVDGTPSVRVGDTLIFKNGKVGYVQAIASSAPWVVTVQMETSITATAQKAVLAAGDFFGIYSNANIDGSGPRASIVSKPLMFQNNTQMFRDDFVVVGTEEANKLSFKVEGGKEYYMYEGEMEAFARFRQAIMFGMLLNPSTTFSDASGNNAPITQGLLNKIENDGINYLTTTGGQFGITDFANIALALDAENAPNEMNFYVGNELGMQVTNNIANSFRNGAIVYNTFGSNGKEKAIDLGFDSFTYNNRSFHVQKLGAMYHPQITALPGFNSFSSGGFMLPVDKQVDARSGAKINSVMLRYKTNGSVDRRYKSTKIGFDITSIDKTSVSHFGELGLEVVGANRMVRIK